MDENRETTEIKETRETSFEEGDGGNNNQTRWIIIGAAVFLILALLTLGTITLLSRLLSGPSPTPTPTPTPIISPTPTSTPTPTPTPTPTLTPTPTPLPPTPTPTPRLISLAAKIFLGPGFSLSYPASWGLLTCSNSDNFEFDPESSADQIGAVCDLAQKPITVIVSNNLTGCGGESLNLGRITTLHSAVQRPTYFLHQWCTNTTPVLKISHRVNDTPRRGVGTVDRSAEVETMISTLRPASA